MPSSTSERENFEVKVNFAKSCQMAISKMQILTAPPHAPLPLGETGDNCRPGSEIEGKERTIETPESFATTHSRGAASSEKLKKRRGTRAKETVRYMNGKDYRRYRREASPRNS